MCKVSIVIPTYNCAKYLSEALDSVLGQTYRDFEVIVVDDGSVDNTKSVIEEYVGKTPNMIRYFYQENKGLAGAKNRGIREAKGKLISFLDADDKFLPTILEKCINCLMVNVNYDVVVTEWCQQIIDNGGKVISEEVNEIDDFPDTEEEFYSKVFTDFMLNSYMLVRKSYLDKVGYFDENILFGEDLDIWRRFAKQGVKVGLIREPLFVYRKRGKSLTTNNNLYKFKGQIKLIDKYKKDIFSDEYLRKYYAEILWDIGRKAFYSKVNPMFVFRCMLKSQMYFPSISRLSKSLLSVVGINK